MTHARPDVGSMPEPHMKRLIVIGAGGYGRVCLDIARMSGYEVIGFCDAAQPDGARINGVPVLGGNEIILAGSRSDDASFVVAIGDQFLKRELAELTIHVGCKLETLIHPSATISPHASIGDGTVVMPNCVVNANAVIGRFCLLNTASTVDHDNTLHDGVQLGPGVHLAGHVSLAEDVLIGTGASVIPGVSIGRNTTVGAGAVVIDDLPPAVTAVGVPAGIISGPY